MRKSSLSLYHGQEFEDMLQNPDAVCSFQQLTSHIVYGIVTGPWQQQGLFHRQCGLCFFSGFVLERAREERPPQMCCHANKQGRPLQVSLHSEGWQHNLPKPV